MLTLGVDLDGTVRDWSGMLRRVWYYETGDYIPAERCTDYNLGTVFRHPGFNVYDIAFETHVDKMCGACEPLPGALATLQWLREQGVRLVAVTAHARPAARYHTLQWLLKHGLPFDGVEFTGKGVPKSVVAADLFIDDAPDVVQELQAAGKRVLIYDQPYNRTVAGERVLGWEEIHAYVARVLDNSSIVE